MSSRPTERYSREERTRSRSRDRRRHDSRSASPRRRSHVEDRGDKYSSRRHERRSSSRDRHIGSSTKHSHHHHSAMNEPRRGSPRRRSGSRERKRKDRSRSRTRSRSRSRSRERTKTRRRSRSSSSEASRGHGDDEERRRRRKERKREKKERKERKREKKRAKVAGAEEWGKYGTIDESDMYNKNEEFRTWLIEEKMMNHEMMGKDETRKLFKEFVEDYNTATLPHKKYYDMAAYERSMDLLRSGASALQELGGYDINADMMAHSKSHKRAPVETESHLSKEQIQELRRVQMQRDQIGKMKAAGIDVGHSFGVRMDGNNFDE